MNPTQIPPITPAPEPVDITPADILRCAAVYLELHGWHQGTLYPDSSVRSLAILTTPPACAYGAIGMASFGRPIPLNNGPFNLDAWRLNNRACGAFDDGTPVNQDAWRLNNRACAAFDDYLVITYPDDVYHVDPDNDTFYEDGEPELHGDAWSDTPGRTAAEVISALNGAADYYDRTHTGGAR